MCLERKKQTIKLMMLMLLLLIVGLTTGKTVAEEKRGGQDAAGKVGAQAKLDCQPGELRHFNYESSTRVWGSANQQVRLRASLRLRCMESPLNTTLKYMAEVLSMEPLFEGADRTWAPEAEGDHSKGGRSLTTTATATATAPEGLNAEPVFEGVSEAFQLTANRMRRSLSGWLSQIWNPVKDFFVNIFNSGDRSSVSRDQAYSESGIDIANQCKSKKRPAAGLPIDESVFDDLEPKYYIGASSDPLLGTAYLFDDDDASAELDEEANLSFFDEPKARSRSRSRRAAVGSERASRWASDEDKAFAADKQLKLPFIFFQSRAGKIIELRFSPNETDALVKNFKRHLCDLFATNLDTNKSQLNEISPIGQHSTRYLVDSSQDLASIKQTLMKSANLDANKELANKQLVRVLALNSRHPTTTQVMDGDGDGDDDDDQRPDDDPVGVSVLAREPNAGRPGDSGAVSVLRSINSTSSIKLNSRTISPDIERLQVQVEQVQQISDGRMTQSAGQLGVSLFQQPTSTSSSGGSAIGNRYRRSPADKADSRQVADIADLLQVTSFYSVQLVPLSRLGNFSTTPAESQTELPTTFVTLAASEQAKAVAVRPKRAAQVQISKNSTSKPRPGGGSKSASSRKRRQRPEPLVIRPASGEELDKSLRELRLAESKLQLTSSSSLLPESSSDSASTSHQADSSVLAMQTRLELIRDQIQMRLNEEFMRNRLRDRTLDAIRQHAQASLSSPSPSSSSSMRLQVSSEKRQPPNSLGLALTQLVLDSGITSKRKGSVYSTIEEALELESQLDEDSQVGSVSRLMSETIRLEKLKQHCKSSIATLEEIRSQSARLEMREPLSGKLADVDEDSSGDSWSSSSSSSSSLQKERFARVVAKVESKNKRRLEQCKQVVQLMLRVGDRKVADLIIDLIDECNARLIKVSKDEELGYGPASKYYRSLRQQFIELMASINKPTELMLDRLMNRLQLASQTKSSSPSIDWKSSARAGTSQQDNRPEFIYVGSRSGSSNQSDPGSLRYNRSLLRDEDYAINNNDVLGSLLMTLTSLASRSTIRQEKRVQLAQKLLMALKGGTCSAHEGPDLDVLESMGNFREPLDEMVGKIIQLAKRCQAQEQYVVASVHALRGQLHHPGSQRFLIDLVKSANVSCTVKSEIVLTLLDAILLEDLRSLQPSLWWPNEISSAGSSARAKQEPRAHLNNRWPAYGLNKLDDTLIELVDPKSSKSLAQDRKCLSGLVGHYLGSKHQLSTGLSDDSSGEPVQVNTSGQKRRRESRRRGMGTRFRRAVINDDKFWDEAHCKRWLLPDLNGTGADGSLMNSMASDLVDEIDDNSISMAIANSKRFREARKNQELLERELPGSELANSTVAIDSFVRKRHKCTASKKYGPKNAEATLRAEIVNDLIGAKDENKFLARFRLGTNFLGNRIDVGRMYLWHQRQTTRAHVNILGKSLWDTSQSCSDKAPHHLLYMPLFDFNLWLVKVSVGLKLQSEMGFFSNCQQEQHQRRNLDELSGRPNSDQLELFPTISLRASGEASAKFVMARAGMSLASQYGYQGSIRVSRQPSSCMSIQSAHQPMNVTFSSWFQLWDSDCHYWGSRNRAEPQATRWRLAARKATVWLDDECLMEPSSNISSSSASSSPLSRRSAHSFTLSP